MRNSVLRTRPSDEARPLPRFGRYEILGRLGAGGMAEVFLARMPLTRAVDATHGYQFVALKKILPHLASDSTFVSRFKREAMIATRLDHPNIAQVYKAGRLGARWFMVMELVRGETFSRVLERERQRGGAVPIDFVRRCGAQIARALHFVHELRHDGRPLHIVHRDVSPQNVMLGYDGRAKLIDFGVARWVDSTTRTGSLAGKVRYFSPEQIRGKSVDRRSDIYSLGVMLYEALLGGPAFAGQNEMAIMEAILQGKPRKIADAPAAVLDPLRRAMSPDPRDRFATAQDFADALVATTAEGAAGAADAAIAVYLQGLIPEGARRWATILERATAGLPFDDEASSEDDGSARTGETVPITASVDPSVLAYPESPAPEASQSVAFALSPTMALPAVARTFWSKRARTWAAATALGLLVAGVAARGTRRTVAATVVSAPRAPMPIEITPLPAPAPIAVEAPETPPPAPPIAPEPKADTRPRVSAAARELVPARQPPRGPGRRRQHATVKTASVAHRAHSPAKLAHADSRPHVSPTSIADQLEPSPYGQRLP